MSNNELDSLIKLIDDPDDSIFTHVKDRLLELGQDAIPALESAWEEHSFGVVFQERIENIIHSIQFDNVREALQNWKNNGGTDLLEGALIVARYQFPDLDEGFINATLKRIEQDIWIELNDNLTALEKVRVINHLFFEIHSFTGNKTNYHAPQNSYINSVIETRKGNPLTLSVLYIALARKLGLPVYGVNLPNHFILCYLDVHKKDNVDLSKKQSVLFYINTFSRGSVLSKREIDHFLKQLKLDPKPMFYQPCDNVSVIRRMLNNLIYSYQKMGYNEKAEEVLLLQQVIDG